MNKEQENKEPGIYLNSQYEDFSKIMNCTTALEQRVAHMEGMIVDLEANVSALLTCLRIFGKVDGNELAAAYERYSKDYHQQLVEPVAKGSGVTSG